MTHWFDGYCSFLHFALLSTETHCCLFVFRKRITINLNARCWSFSTQANICLKYPTMSIRAPYSSIGTYVTMALMFLIVNNNEAILKSFMETTKYLEHTLCHIPTKWYCGPTMRCWKLDGVTSWGGRRRPLLTIQGECKASGTWTSPNWIKIIYFLFQEKMSMNGSNKVSYN